MRMVIKNADIPDYVRPADLPEHLGGHNGTTQNDIGALEWAIKKFDIKSMVDVGCGTGRMVRMAEERGLTSMGIDGDGTIDRDTTMPRNYSRNLGTTCEAPTEKEKICPGEARGGQSDGEHRQIHKYV